MKRTLYWELPARVLKKKSKEHIKNWLLELILVSQFHSLFFVSKQPHFIVFHFVDKNPNDPDAGKKFLAVRHVYNIHLKTTFLVLVQRSYSPYVCF